MNIDITTIECTINGHKYHLVCYYENHYLVSVDDSKGFIQFYVPEDGVTRFQTAAQYVDYLAAIDTEDLRTALKYINNAVLERLEKADPFPQTYANFCNN